MPDSTYQPIYLASASPRRQQLLQQIDVSFELLKIDVEEIPQKNESPDDFVKRIALAKAQAGWDHPQRTQDKAVLGADTVVITNGQIFGKPRDEADAKHMLQALSGKAHQVMSAVALVQNEQRDVVVSTTTVTFRTITEQEIQDHWQSGEPKDKAGAYGIQGRGAIFISKIEGSYSGVMGLPLFETAELLK